MQMNDILNETSYLSFSHLSARSLQHWDANIELSLWHFDLPTGVTTDTPVITAN